MSEATTQSDDMTRGLERLREETAVAERIHSDRGRVSGRLSPRQRITALVEHGSFLELGGLARTQLPVTSADTPADGLITGYGRIHGREAGVLTEDALVLNTTDGQVARGKQQRMLGTSIARNMPVVYLADGPTGKVHQAQVGTGRLWGGLGRGYEEPDPRRLEAPLVAVILGVCRGVGAELAMAADLIVATASARITQGDGSEELPAIAEFADIVAADDLEAIKSVQRFFETLPADITSPLARLRPPGERTARGELEEDASTPLAVASIVDAILDDGSVLEMVAPRSETIATGLGTVDGFPVAFASTGGETPALLGAPELRRLARVARLARRFRIPLVTVQDCAGYDPRESGSSEFMRALRDLNWELMSSSVKLSVIIGEGHAMGTFVLGGRQLGYDCVMAWPTAKVTTMDVPTYHPGCFPDGCDREPWLAAGLGVIDDVIAPHETREHLLRMIELLAPSRAYPTPADDRRGRFIDELPTV